MRQATVRTAAKPKSRNESWPVTSQQKNGMSAPMTFEPMIEVGEENRDATRSLYAARSPSESDIRARSCRTQTAVRSRTRNLDIEPTSGGALGLCSPRPVG